MPKAILYATIVQDRERGRGGREEGRGIGRKRWNERGERRKGGREEEEKSGVHFMLLTEQ